jgi:hypothetical protein
MTHLGHFGSFGSFVGAPLHACVCVPTMGGGAPNDPSGSFWVILGHLDHLGHLGEAPCVCVPAMGGALLLVSAGCC